jgi:sialate O-acetylesterase
MVPCCNGRLPCPFGAPPGGPYTLSVAGESNTLTVSNVLVGEVWLCSGQSNMAFPLSRATNADQAISASRDPQLRLYTVPRGASDTPLSE